MARLFKPGPEEQAVRRALQRREPLSIRQQDILLDWIASLEDVRERYRQLLRDTATIVPNDGRPRA
jgi:hypothetical protein